MPASQNGEAHTPAGEGNHVVLLWVALLLATLWGILAFDYSLGSDINAQETGGPLTFRLLAIPPARQSAAPTVSLWAMAGRSIDFMSQNGKMNGEQAPELLHIPHLILNRNGRLTDPAERTLVVDLAGLEVPPPGLTVTLQVETQHGDPDQGGSANTRIAVWRQERWLENRTGNLQRGVTMQFQHEFQARLPSGASTPTDLMRIQVTVVAPPDGDWRLLYTLRKDYVFLLENQWHTALPPVRAESARAAPQQMVVYYCDMFPSHRLGASADMWLRRDEVTPFVEKMFVPAAVEAFRRQANDWQFSWYEPETGGESSGPLEISLAAPDTWFHGQSPDNGHAGISMNIDTVGAGYETLLDGMMSTFHHELFHNLQRSAYRRVGLSQEGNWDLVTEGTAMLASAVGQPEVQFETSVIRRAYLASMAAFVGEGMHWPGEMNRSYAEISYNGVAYWRFLYETCGGLTAEGENPAAGMEVIRRAMAALYEREAREPLSPAGFVTEFPALMDQALSGTECPFDSHEESLVEFAQAVYALRLGTEWCSRAGSPAGCAFYDPGDQYPEPAIDTIVYTGTTLFHGPSRQLAPAGIPSSYGIDLVEVELQPGAEGRALTIEILEPGGPDGLDRAAEFRALVWKLRMAGPGRAGAVAPAEPLTRPAVGAPLSLTLPAVDTTEVDRLALIITRIDSQEQLDPRGAYTIVLRSHGR